MEGEVEKLVVDVFFQNYGPEDGISPHWCCKFIRDGWADYEYFDTAEEAYNFAAQHGYTGAAE